MKNAAIDFEVQSLTPYQAEKLAAQALAQLSDAAFTVVVGEELANRDMRGPLVSKLVDYVEWCEKADHGYD